MNEEVRKILDEEKRKFCLEHKLFAVENMPYLIEGEGNTEDGKRFKFRKVTKERYGKGDTILVNLNGEILSIKIDTFQYEYDPDTKYMDCEWYMDSRFPENKRFYKKVVTDITDEEFYLLRQIYPPAPPIKDRGISTEVDTVLCVIGVLIFIASIIAGSVIGSEESASLGWTIFIVGFIQSFLFIGFGKVIDLLCEIANR